MTDTVLLKKLGLDKDEITEMREEGARVAMEFDVKAARSLAEKYDSLGLTEKSLELYNAAYSNANYWIDTVKDWTGKNIEYDVAYDHWRDTDTGRFAPNPVIDIRVDQYDLYYHILDLYG